MRRAEGPVQPEGIIFFVIEEGVRKCRFSPLPLFLCSGVRGAAGEHAGGYWVRMRGCRCACGKLLGAELHFFQISHLRPAGFGSVCSGPIIRWCGNEKKSVFAPRRFRQKLDHQEYILRMRIIIRKYFEISDWWNRLSHHRKQGDGIFDRPGYSFKWADTLPSPEGAKTSISVYSAPALQTGNI